MRVISEFHDYYDVVQAQGQDQTLLFVRKAKEEPIVGTFPFPHAHFYNSRFIQGKVSFSVRRFIVGFCGRIYPVLHLSKNYLDFNICHTLEDVDHFVETHYGSKEFEEYKNTPAKKRWKTRYWSGDVLRGGFRGFFAECEKQKDAYKQMFIEAACPIFVAHYRNYRESTITWNGSLREHEFFRVFDTFTAFQEIAMFMSNLAVPLKPIPEVPDKVLAGAKGFNEWSFRKPPKER